MQQRIAVEDESQVGEARRVAASLSRMAGLGEADAGRVAIIVTELGSNLRKHAGGGELLIRELRLGSRSGVEVLSIDRGPGMEVERALTDGHSTASTRGEGLGAVRRLATEFDAWSGTGGSAVVARVWASGPPPEPVAFGVVSQPLQGQAESGDGWEVRGLRSVIRLLVADGLGHGPIAARAAAAAVEAFQGADRLPGPEAVVHELHGALRPTRGAAVAVVELDLVSRVLKFAGLGNISGTLDVQGRGSRGLVSHSGIAGHEARRIQEFSFPWGPRTVLVVHSDGLHTNWKLESYPGLQARHPSLIAAILYRDFRRASDDATVVVVKEP
ncbi:MAG TPA: ATP-binding protein [Myxococcales bacterium]|nr:ATP-binding protein [Myxococcales bacterium]